MVIRDKIQLCNGKGQAELTLGPDVRIGAFPAPKMQIEAPGYFIKKARLDAGHVGAFSFFNRACDIRCLESVGRYSMFAPNCSIGLPEHPSTFLTGHISLIDNQFFGGEAFYALASNPEWVREYRKNYNSEMAARSRGNKKAVVGNDVWIGQNALVLRHISIGDGAIVAAGSVVTKDVAPYTIVGGIPARVIKQRFSDSIVERLTRIKWWNFTPDVFAGMDIAHPSHALLDKLEERMQSAAPFLPDVFEFDEQAGTITRIDAITHKRTKVFDNSDGGNA